MTSQAVRSVGSFKIVNNAMWWWAHVGVRCIHYLRLKRCIFLLMTTSILKNKNYLKDCRAFRFDIILYLKLKLFIMKQK